MNFLVFVTFLLSAIQADWPAFIWGRCPSVVGTPNFNSVRYLKKWYQQSALPQIFQDSSQRCVTAEYTPLTDGIIGVYNSGVDEDGVRSGVTGAAVVTSTTNRGELNVAFFSTPSASADANYIVLDTDYTSFTYVWDCTNFGFFHVPALWIMTRDPNPTVESLEQHEQEAIDILKGFHYSKSIQNRLLTTEHNCD